MHLDHRTVSRKTPRDGKLEISAEAARRLRDVGDALHAEWLDQHAPAALTQMSCTCGGGSERHEHHFLESAIFRTLPVGRDVDLWLEGSRVGVGVTPSS